MIPFTASAASDPDLAGALDLLETRRAPYADLLAEIIADVLGRFPAPAGGPIVEIGAGSGQLRRWLPAAARDRTLHTDPSRPALARLLQAAPEAAAALAVAQRLPLADGGAAAVLGLDVFDAVHAQGTEAAAVAEAARILRPGGWFVHFLEMATLLETPFGKLAASSLVPIPNVLGDPGDHEWPLDVVLLPRDWLAGVLEIARRARHPFSAAFAEHFQPFLEPRFDPRAATRAFQALAASGDRRAALAALLASASRLAVGEGHPPSRPVPFHSGRYLLSVLEAAFAGSAAFRIELAEIATRSAWRPRLPGAPRYRSLCLGHQRIADELPARLLDPARARPARPGVAAGPEEDALTEVGVFVFAARRVP